MLKSKIPKVVSLILIVALIVPVLLAVPVSAVVTASGTSGNLSWYVDDGVFTLVGSGNSATYSSTGVPWKDSTFSGISIPSTVLKLSSYFFTGCTFTGPISLPINLTLNSYFFTKCTGTSLYVNCATLPNYCFYNASFDYVFLADSVTTLSSSAFSSFTGTVYLPATPPSISTSGSNTTLGGVSNVNFVVPAGSTSAYLADSQWASLASQFVEASPSIPTLTTSFAGQVVNIDAGSINFFIFADNVNGSLSCEWYINGELYQEIFDFNLLPNGIWAQGWQYTPVGNGTREIYAIVKNTLNGEVASISTGTVIVNVGVGSGGDSGGDPGGDSGGDSGGGAGGDSSDLSNKLDSVQGAVNAVADKLDAVEADVADMKTTVNSIAENVENLPDDIQNGMQNVIDGEKENATNAGGNYVDQILDIVPNDSQGFIDSMGSLVSSLGYDGTECVLKIPALTLPAISGLFPSYTVMKEQEVDFREFFNMMPSNIMLLVQSLFTIALIVYCFKEFYDTISYFFTLKGGEK